MRFAGYDLGTVRLQELCNRSRYRVYFRINLPSGEEEVPSSLFKWRNHRLTQEEAETIYPGEQVRLLDVASLERIDTDHLYASVGLVPNQEYEVLATIIRERTTRKP